MNNLIKDKEGVYMLKGNNESYIYVVDDDYRIKYCNANSKLRFPGLEVGTYCFDMIKGEKEPCQDCPLQKANQGTAIFYNRKLHQWQEVNNGIIDMPDDQTYYLMHLHDVKDSDRNRFYNLAILSIYDELFELNVTKDRYKIISHTSGKYVIPEIEGKLSEMIQEVLDKQMIHPDDHEAFLKFWDFDRIRKAFQSNEQAALEGRFRKQKTNGEYCWVLQSVVPISHQDGDDEIIMCFIQEIKATENHTFEIQKKRNELTGLYNKTDFLKLASMMLQQSTTPYCMIAVDIEHFKLFNEWYGLAAGDRFLQSVGYDLKDIEEQLQGIGGYLGGDDFAMLIPYREDHIDMILKRLMKYDENAEENIGFFPAIGVYVIDDKNLSITTIYDRSVLALTTVKGNYIHRIAYYKPALQSRIEEEHKILLDFQQGLEHHEFVLYLQPKCNIITGKIVGSEALVRWQHPKKGLLMPGAFIPLLERKGIIGKLDYYVWESACQHIRKWMDEGVRPLPISVNLSRIDIFTMDVVKCFKELIQKYQIEQDLIEIEITESAYVEEYDKVTAIITELRKAGFHVLMDDFGSGYSSLNMLKDVNVDVLKIDMKFLNIDEKAEGKDISILEAIINMAKLMSLHIIAEGVERAEQVDLLIDTGCMYAQGYLFYKPMDASSFENVIRNQENVDYRGMLDKHVDYISVRDLLSYQDLSDTMLHNILGAIAFFKYNGKSIQLQSVNQNFCKIIEEDSINIEEERTKIMTYIHGSDQEKLFHIFDLAHEHPVNGAADEIRFIKPDGSYKWLQVHIFFLKQIDESGLYYGQINDITEQKHKEEQLETSQNALAAAVHMRENNESFMNLAEENRALASSLFAQISTGGMLGAYCEKDYPLLFANDEFIQLLGYSSYDEFSKAIQGNVINIVHPDDQERVKSKINENLQIGQEYTVIYRSSKKDGTWFWSLDKGKAIETKNGRLAVISACIDISQTIASQQQLTMKNKKLEKMNQELYFLNNKLPGGYHRCANTPEYDFLYISSRFLQLFNYTRSEIHELFNDKFILMVHPDDRERVDNYKQNISLHAETDTIEYRMITKDGFISVIDQTSVQTYEGKRFYQSVVINITETVALRNKMQLLMKYTYDDIFLINLQGNNTSYEIITHGLASSYGYSEEEYQILLENKQIQRKICDTYEDINSHMRKAIQEKVNYNTIFTANIQDKNVLIKITLEFIDEEQDTLRYLCVLSDVTSLKDAENKILLTNKKMETIMSLAHINYWDWDLNTNKFTLNNTSENSLMREILGKDQKQIVMNDYRNALFDTKYLSMQQQKEFINFIQEVAHDTTQEMKSMELPLQINSSIVWVEIVCKTILDDKHHPIRVVGYYTDITHRKYLETMNRDTQTTLNILKQQAIYDFRASLVSDTIIPDKGGEEWINDTGYHGDMSYTKLMKFVIEHVSVKKYKNKLTQFTDRMQLMEAFRNGENTKSVVYQRHYKGKLVWAKLMIHLVKHPEDNDVLAYIFVMDIDEQKRQELQLTKMAQTDSLTGLSNRSSAILQIREYLKICKDKKAALVMVDLDNFKTANDVFGHAYGDKLLAHIATKMKNFFRQNDIVSRFGGDEFLILCKDIEEHDVHEKIHNLLMNLTETNKDKGQSITFTASSGYVLIPNDGNDFDELYQKADIAMFAAKIEGKNTVRKYNSSMKQIRYELAKKKRK